MTTTCLVESMTSRVVQAMKGDFTFDACSLFLYDFPLRTGSVEVMSVQTILNPIKIVESMSFIKNMSRKKDEVVEDRIVVYQHKDPERENQE